MTLLKTQTGALVPLDDDEMDKMRRFKVGSVIRAEYKEMRNGKFFRKWWALMAVAYDMWTDGIQFQEYCGQQVQPNKDRFRKDITILAGYFHPVYALDGSMTMEADSIAWASMGEDKFERLYSACVDVILAKVLAHKNISRKQLDESVDAVLRFT